MTKEERQILLKSMKLVYDQLVSAPDTSLSPSDAWQVGCAYALEFTCRELFMAGLITRQDGREILRHTGGTIGDAERWKR